MFISIYDISLCYSKLFNFLHTNYDYDEEEDINFILKMFNNDNIEEMYDENNSNNILWKGIFLTVKYDISASEYFNLGILKHNCYECVFYKNLLENKMENFENYNEMKINAYIKTFEFIKNNKIINNKIKNKNNKFTKIIFNKILMYYFEKYNIEEIDKIINYIENCEDSENFENIKNIYKYSKFMMLRDKDSMIEMENYMISNNKYDIIPAIIDYYVYFGKYKKCVELLEKYKFYITQDFIKKYELFKAIYDIYLNANENDKAEEFLNENYKKSILLYEAYCRKINNEEDIIKIINDGFEIFKTGSIYYILIEYFIKNKNEDKFNDYIIKCSDYNSIKLISFLIGYYSTVKNIELLEKYCKIGMDINLEYAVNAFIILLINKIIPEFGYNNISKNTTKIPTLFTGNYDYVKDLPNTIIEQSDIEIINKYYDIIIPLIDNDFIFSCNNKINILENMYYLYLKINDNYRANIIFNKLYKNNENESNYNIVSLRATHYFECNMFEDGKNLIKENINTCNASSVAIIYYYGILFRAIGKNYDEEFCEYLKEFEMIYDSSIVIHNSSLIKLHIESIVKCYFEYYDNLIKKEININDEIIFRINKLLNEYYNEKNIMSEKAIEWNKKNKTTYIYSLETHVMNMMLRYLRKIFNNIEIINFLENNCDNKNIIIKGIIDSFKNQESVKYYYENLIPTEKECPVCLNTVKNIVGLNCTIEHYLCTDCYFKTGKCPFKCGVIEEENEQQEFTNFIANILGGLNMELDNSNL
jgi:hypothetical protein